MAYSAVVVYTLDGTFLGYAIKNDASPKMSSPNLYTEDEKDKLDERLSGLNENLDLSAVWPDARDPEVQSILADASFRPLEMIEDEVVDDENSYYVYEQEPELDVATGAPTGRMINGTLNREASVLAYKRMMVPARPSDVMERTKAACEIVARKRAGR